MNQPVTTRKTIDFTEEQVKQMERVREERKVTYNELMGTAWDTYLGILSGKNLASVTTPTLEHLVETLEHMQQRLWSLDSSSQKTAERLGTLESMTQQTMELLLLLSEVWAAAKDIPIEPESMPDTPVTDENLETDEVVEPAQSRWHIPDPEVSEKRGWFRRSKP